ncbi:ACT domain-containing protein [Amycolatopsis magusensis]|uniref:ACT domain-containing protein n=1 Tax=Amycolatopsis magusensis TaxID=882444 RepID=UPI003C2BB9F9
MRRLVIDVQPLEYAVARLDPDQAVPADLLTHSGQVLVSVTRTQREVSIICPAKFAPPGAKVEADWRLLSVRGPLAFTLTGIIAALASELAAAGVGLFTLSTFETDHVLVKSDDLTRAIDALQAAGHDVSM